MPHDVARVPLCRTDTDYQLASDFLVGVTLHQQSSDFPFARRQVPLIGHLSLRPPAHCEGARDRNKIASTLSDSLVGGQLCCNAGPAAFTVFTRSIATVIGPTPPVYGVTQEATSRTSIEASPTRR